MNDTSGSGSLTVDAIPSEVLAMVFMEAIHANALADESYTASAVDLSHVSHRWRHISLSTSCLWADIRLYYPFTPQLLRRTSAYLLRSGTNPLSILIDFRDPDWNWDEDTHGFTWEMMACIMGFLLPQASRWRELRVLVDTWAPVYALLWFINEGPVPSQLQTLSLSRCNAYFACMGAFFRPGSLLATPALFGGVALASLRNLCLIGTHVDWKQCGAITGLTSLELKYHAENVLPSKPDLMAILSRSPNLNSLKLTGNYSPLGQDADPLLVNSDHSSTIELRYLTHMTFGFVEEARAMDCLSWLRLPALVSLELEDVSASLTLDIPHDWSALIRRLSTDEVSINVHHITHLVLAAVKGTSSAFVSLFRACTSLRKLELKKADEESLAALSLQHHDDVDKCSSLACPNLEELVCKGMSAFALLQLILNRPLGSSNQSMLRKVVYDNLEQWEPASDHHIERLEEAGVVIIRPDF